jgi:hypothetical protein
MTFVMIIAAGIGNWIWLWQYRCRKNPPEA